jgi:hypothetical protein
MATREGTMYIIVVYIILVSGGAGEATLDNPIYSSLAECEVARPVKVQGLQRVIEARHGPAELRSSCESRDTRA